VIHHIGGQNDSNADQFDRDDPTRRVCPSPASLSFGTQTQGSPSAARAVTVSNTGCTHPTDSRQADYIGGFGEGCAQISQPVCTPLPRSELYRSGSPCRIRGLRATVANFPCNVRRHPDSAVQARPVQRNILRIRSEHMNTEHCRRKRLAAVKKSLGMSTGREMRVRLAARESTQVIQQTLCFL
jgi:hypothetical protein